MHVSRQETVSGDSTPATARQGVGSAPLCSRCAGLQQKSGLDDYEPCSRCAGPTPDPRGAHAPLCTSAPPPLGLWSCLLGRRRVVEVAQGRGALDRVSVTLLPFDRHWPAYSRATHMAAW